MDNSISTVHHLDVPAPAYTPADPMAPGKVANTTGAQSVYIAVFPLDQLKDEPAPVDCPVCGVKCLTDIKHRFGDKTMYITAS